MTSAIRVRRSTTAQSAADDAAAWVAARAVALIERTGRFVWAVSGGSTPAVFLESLATHDQVDWSAVHLFQVDERIAPAGSRDRNDTMIRERFVDHRPLVQYHSMPVEAGDERSALAGHLSELEHLAGTPARLDLIQLGLGADGHTASLVPGDPVLEATTDVAVSAEYKGSRRWTMTAPLINRARERLFLVTGAEKDEALHCLATGDPGIPGSLITDDQTFLVTDRQIPGFSPTPW